MEKIVPGTNEDVWAFKNLHAIAVHYPDMPDDFGMFGSQAFFFDYYKSINEAIDDLQDKVNNQGWTFVYGQDSFQAGPSPTSYAPSHKWVLIWLAWRNYLVKTKSKPDHSLFSRIFHDINISSGSSKRYVDHPSRAIFLPATNLGQSYDRQLDKWISLDKTEKMNITHPFCYFPPIADTGIFEQITFFDPSKSGVYLNKLTRQYGSINGMKIFNACQGKSKKTMYSDIISSTGYGFNINFRSVGLDVSFHIPFPGDYFNVQHFRDLIATNSTGTAEDSEPHREAGIVGYKIVPIYYGDWLLPTHAAEVYRRRDSWIQSWIKGAPIPLNLNSIIDVQRFNDDYFEYWRVCQSINSLYPIKIEYTVDSGIGALFDALFKVATIVGSVTHAALAGDTYDLAMFFINTGASAIKALIPDSRKYIDMAIPLLVVPFLKEAGLSDPKKSSNATKFLMSLSKATVSSMTQEKQNDLSFNTESMIDSMNESMTDREKEIINAISERLSNNSMEVAVSTPSRDLSKLFESMETKKTSNELLLGAGLIGAALLLKKYI